MFVIVTYDVNEKHVAKTMRTCRKYLTHVQKSVFEGMITQSKLNSLKAELEKTIDITTDSICIYQIENIKYTCKEELGKIKDATNIL